MLVCMRATEREEENGREKHLRARSNAARAKERDEKVRLGQALSSDPRWHEIHQEEAILAIVYKLRRVSSLAPLGAVARKAHVLPATLFSIIVELLRSPGR